MLWWLSEGDVFDLWFKDIQRWWCDIHCIIQSRSGAGKSCMQAMSQWLTDHGVGCSRDGWCAGKGKNVPLSSEDILVLGMMVSGKNLLLCPLVGVLTGTSGSFGMSMRWFVMQKTLKQINRTEKIVHVDHIVPSPPAPTTPQACFPPLSRNTLWIHYNTHSPGRHASILLHHTLSACLEGAGGTRVGHGKQSWPHRLKNLGVGYIAANIWPKLHPTPVWSNAACHDLGVLLEGVGSDH